MTCNLIVFSDDLNLIVFSDDLNLIVFSDELQLNPRTRCFSLRLRTV